MMEKAEECPRCGEVARWRYNAQQCDACGYPQPDALVQELVEALKQIEWLDELSGYTLTVADAQTAVRIARETRQKHQALLDRIGGKHE